MVDRKEYLGDSVYVDIEWGDLVLTTDNGEGPSNTIVLELEIYEQLVLYVNKHKAIAQL